MQNTEPKFSFLIANYNNGRYFNDCYKSIIAQTVQDWQVIILDDCSTDDSILIIENIIGDDSRFHLKKNNKNQGVGFTKRRLVDLANSELCGFLDPDDALEKNALELMINAHDKDKQVGLIYSNFTFCDQFLQKQRPHQAKQIEQLDINYYNFRGEISHFATFKKSFYNLTEGIDVSLKIAEDKDWYMKMCEIAPVKHINTCLYLYRVHEGGISTNKNTDKAFFWHFVALIKMAERRKINIEDLFFEKFMIKSQSRSELENERDKIANLKNSRLLKLLHKIGIFKAYKYL